MQSYEKNIQTKRSLSIQCQGQNQHSGFKYLVIFGEYAFTVPSEYHCENF